MIIYFYDYSLAAVSSCCTSSQAVTVLVIFTICSLLVYSISLVTTRLDRSFVWAFPLSLSLASRLLLLCSAGKSVWHCWQIYIKRIGNTDTNKEWH